MCNILPLAVHGKINISNNFLLEHDNADNVLSRTDISLPVTCRFKKMIRETRAVLSTTNVSCEDGTKCFCCSCFPHFLDRGVSVTFLVWILCFSALTLLSQPALSEHSNQYSTYMPVI